VITRVTNCTSLASSSRRIHTPTHLLRVVVVIIFPCLCRFFLLICFYFLYLFVFCLFLLSYVCVLLLFCLFVVSLSSTCAACVTTLFCLRLELVFRYTHTTRPPQLVYIFPFLLFVVLFFSSLFFLSLSSSSDSNVRLLLVAMFPGAPLGGVTRACVCDGGRRLSHDHAMRTHTIHPFLCYSHYAGA